MCRSLFQTLGVQDTPGPGSPLCLRGTQGVLSHVLCAWSAGVADRGGGALRGTRPLLCLYQRCPEQRRTHWALSDRGGGRLPAAPASWAADEVSGLESWTSRSEQPGRTPKAGSRLGCAPRLRRPPFQSPRFQSRPHSHLCPRLAPGRVHPELSPRVFAWKPRALTPVSRARASAPPPGARAACPLLGGSRLLCLTLCCLGERCFR